MGALSYFSNWETPFELHNSGFSSFFTPPQTEELPPRLLACTSDDFDFTFYDDNYFDPNEFFYFDKYCNSLPTSFNAQNQLLNPKFPAQQPLPFREEFDPCNYSKLKRQRTEELDYNDVMFADSLFNDPVPTPYLNFEQFSVAQPALPDFAISPPAFNIGCFELSVKNQQTSVTAQSITARQRRRKIADKTQELSKLIPGAHRMNTAEMFGAAYKYIKFLKAQVGILDFMASYDQEKGEAFGSEELHGLVESTMVQEKLYSTENCLVPTKFVQELSSDDEMFQAKAYVRREIRELVPET